jgi:heat shock protein HtpX
VATGYVTHAKENRQQLWLVLALYALSIQLIGGLVAMLFIGVFDPANQLLVNPIGYFARYGLPMSLVGVAMFIWLYRAHADDIVKKLDIVPTSRIDEPRFVRVAEEQCIALGVRVPRFGIIETPEPNALAVGEGPSRGLIAVTRGLLDELDDDELGAVIAHEASHIRNGDTKVLAANHALMRTAVHLQVNNPLRFEDWRQLLLPLVLPPFMLIMLLSGMITMTSMQIARMARRGLKLSRDHIADGEAVRVTHRPDALHSALMKIGGRGAFAGSSRFDELLFDGRADGEGATHPAVVDRLTAISTLGRDLMTPGRPRRDTRTNVPVQARAPLFGRKIDPRQFRAKPPVEPKIMKPMELTNDELTKLMFNDWKGYKLHIAQCTAWYEWRESDKRNFLGLKPEMRLPVAGMVALLLTLYWPSDGDYARFAYRFSPSAWSNLMGSDSGGTFCSGSGCEPT